MTWIIFYSLAFAPIIQVSTLPKEAAMRQAVDN